MTERARGTTSVTIVVPTYNEEANIARLIQQMLDEPWTEALVLDEIIIVDDCSEDKTQAITEGLAADHETVRVIRHAERSGKNAGIRTGVAACHSDIVAFVDADVRLGPQCLTKTVHLLASDPSLIASSCLFESVPIRSWRERASRFQLAYVATLGRLGYGALARVYAIRTTIMRAFILPDNTHDDLFIVRWLSNRGYRFAVCSDAVAYLRCAVGLRDFAKQTLRGWRAGEALEQILPPTSTSVQTSATVHGQRRRAVRQALMHAIRREPLGSVLYLTWRTIIVNTPTALWLSVVDHSKYDTSQSTKDLSF